MSTSSSASPSDLLARLRRLAQAGQDLSALVERGQGDGPLARHFAQLGDDLANGPFRLILLGLDAEARGNALAVLCGQDMRVVRFHIPEEVGLVDVRFGERGYVLEGRAGERQQFDQLEPFLAAVEQADLVRESDPGAFVAPMSLRLPGAKGARALHLLVPESPAALLRNPRLLARLVAHSNLMIVAGSASAALSEAESRAVRELSEAMAVVQPLVLGDGTADKGFWSDRGLLAARDVLAPARVAGGALPSFVVDQQDPLRLSAGAAAHAARMRSAALMVKAELGEDRGQVDVRLRALQREQKAMEEGQRERDLRGQVDALRTPAFDGLRRLGEASAEDLRRLGITGGTVESTCLRVVAHIQAHDLYREPISSDKVRLGVSPDMLDACRRSVYEELARACKAQAGLLREGAAALEAQLSQSLTQLRGASVVVRLPGFDEDRVRHAIKELLQSDFEAKAEMERRGFWRRMAQGRQLVFTLLMTISLFGTVLPFDRQQVMRYVVPLFLAGVGMTIFTFRREDKERVQRELERMRDQLSNQFQRRAGDGLRELSDRVRRQLEEMKEQMHRQIEAVGRESEEQHANRTREALRDAQQRLRVQEQRRRDLDALLSKSLELERSSAEVERDAVAALGQALRAAASNGPTGGARP